MLWHVPLSGNRGGLGSSSQELGMKINCVFLPQHCRSPGSGPGTEMRPGLDRGWGSPPRNSSLDD